MKKEYISPAAKPQALCSPHPLLNIQIACLAVRNYQEGGNITVDQYQEGSRTVLSGSLGEETTIGGTSRRTLWDIE